MVRRPAPKRILELKSILPQLYPLEALAEFPEWESPFQELNEDIVDLNPHLKGNGRRERIGSAVEILILPHRFEFIVYPGFTTHDLKEIATKIYLHVKGLSSTIRIGLYLQGKGGSHKTLVKAPEIHTYKLRQFVRLLAKHIPKHIKTAKHLVLHQTAVGGALLGTVIHNPLYNQYFTF